jgi:hypothetical protein
MGNTRNELGDRTVIVTTRSGTIRVVSGWRAWLAAAVVLMVFALLMGLVAFLLLGAAITIGAVLLIVVPIAIVLGVIASFFPSRRRP